MNTPIEHPGHLENIPAEIAVRKAPPTSEFPFKAKPRMPQEAGGPKLGWRPFWFDWPFRAPFEGDLAIKALRQRLALDPDLVPRPPMPSPKKAFAPLLGRLGLMAVVAGMGVYGLTPFTPPRPLLKADSGAPRVADASPGIAPSVRLVIGGRHAFANEPLTLGISLNGATGGEFALLNGLLAGTRLSVGRAFGSTGWRVAARDLTAAIAYAPQDFVGVMNAAIDVRTPSDILLDRNVMRLEWIGKPAERRVHQPRSEREAARAPVPAPPFVPAIRPFDREQVATLIERGTDYLQTGDFPAARLLLRRAADAGSAQAALALGATYDPFLFRELGVLGFLPDPTEARTWYERAGQLGSPEAAPRIDRLARIRQ